jgi:hypothetical protein
MTRNAKHIAAVTAAFLVLGVYWAWDRSGRSVQPQKLAVLFTGMTSNVTRTMGPPRVEVCGSGSGACALFLVTNLTSGQYLWFKTAWVERKAETGWERFTPTNRSWFGPEGKLWGPGYGCFIAVGWPPGLPTNACWRLQVSYGRDPSELGIVINQKSGREFFHSGKAESTLPSSEVGR